MKHVSNDRPALRRTIRTTDGRCQIVAETTLLPTPWFYIFFGCGCLSSFVATVIPSGFCFSNEKTLKDTTTAILQRGENESDSGHRPVLMLQAG